MTAIQIGDHVRNKRNPTKTGIVIGVIDENPRKRRLKIRGDDGDVDDALERTLEVIPETAESFYELLKGFKFAGVKELRLAITKTRLSGSAKNLIYSLNLTNTLFLPYQFKPLINFLRSRSQSLLIADEVGLGKTIEAGLIWTELEMRRNAKRLLVVCPSVLCEKWKAELKSKFNVRAEIVNAGELLEKIKEIKGYDIGRVALIVSLQGIRPPKDWESPQIPGKLNYRGELARYLSTTDSDPSVFDLMILDEAHSVRNRDTQSYKGVELLKDFCSHFIMLSATPIQTSSSNLYTLLNTLAPVQFPSENSLINVIDKNKKINELCDTLTKSTIGQEEFLDRLGEIEDEVPNTLQRKEIHEWINNPPSDETLRDEYGRACVIDKLRRIHPLSQIISRTKKAEVQANRVIRQVFTHKVDLTEAERAFYKHINNAILQYCGDNDKPRGFIAVMPKRLIASSPQAAFEHWAYRTHCQENEELNFNTEDEIESEDGKLSELLAKSSLSFEHIEDLLRNDSKFNTLLTALNHFWKEHPGKKVLLFSFFKTTLRRLERELGKAGIKAVRYDGDIPADERQQIIEKFKKDNSQILLSSEIAAEGIDLQFMNCVVNYDLPWNPAKIEQRIGRIDRIGQESKKIYILNLIHNRTIDCLIYDRLLDRLNIFEAALGISEDILGNELLTLTRKLFSANLTYEQQRQMVEQTAFAIQNLQKVSEQLPGQSMAFDLIEKEIQKANELERYVTNRDLLTYIENFFDKEGSSSRIGPLDPEQNLYELKLSLSVESLFREYLDRHEKDFPNSKFFSANKLPTLRILNKKGAEGNGIERITQNHPLINFITEWMDQNEVLPHKTVAFKLSVHDLNDKYCRNVSKGRYFFAIDSWETHDSETSSVTLANHIYSLDTKTILSEEVSEYLLHKGSLSGESLLSNIAQTLFTPDEISDCYQDADDRLSDAFDEFSEAEKRNFFRDIEFQLEQQNEEKKFAIERYELQVANDTTEQGLKGRLARYANERDRKIKDIEVRKKIIERRRDNFVPKRNKLMMGLLLIE